MFEVVESFVSINGESTCAGELAVFVRFKGCNLHCSYCDTKWANEFNVEYKSMSAEEICELVKNTGVKNVTLTGGEPLLQEGIENLIEKLISQGNRVEIETNGSVFLEKFALMKNRPVFTMDYKLPSSKMERFMQRDNFSLLIPSDTVKFVAGSEEDLEAALEVIEQYDLTEKCHVYFSAVFGKLESSEIVRFMLQHKLNNVRLQLQIHKIIWEPSRRGV